MVIDQGSNVLPQADQILQVGVGQEGWGAKGYNLLFINLLFIDKLLLIIYFPRNIFLPKYISGSY